MFGTQQYSRQTTRLVVLCVLLAVQVLSGQTRQPVRYPKDNPGARAEYEQTLLADPATGKIPEYIRRRELEFSMDIPSASSEAHSKAASAAGIQTQQWTFRGPNDIGGRTRALGIDVANERVLLAGGVSGGMWKSIDAGESWVRVTPLHEIQSVSCIAQDTRPGRTRVWYYGTGEIRGNSAGAPGGSAPYRGDGIYKSQDNGSTWVPLESTRQRAPQLYGGFKYVWRIVTDPSRNDSAIVYAATSGGLFRSNDEGMSWQLTLGGRQPCSTSTEIVVTSQGVLYATFSALGVMPNGDSTSIPAPDRGIYRSVNGLDWTNITPTGYPEAYNRIVPAVAPSDESVVYFLAGAMTEWWEEYHYIHKYTYLSGNGLGQNGRWEDRSSSIPMYDPLLGFGSYQGYTLTIKVKPGDPDFVVIGGTNLFRSTDGFRTAWNPALIGGYNPMSMDWYDQSYPNHHPDIHDIVFLPSNPDVMFTVSDGGIHRTDNCRASQVGWYPLNTGFLTTQFYTVAIDPVKSGDRTIIGGMQDNNTYGSRNPDDEWHWISGGDGGYCAVNPDEENAFYVSCQHGRLYTVVTSEGLDVLDLYETSVEEYDFAFIAPFELDPHNSSRIYLASNPYVYRNSDMNKYDAYQFWEPIPATGPPRGFVSALKISAEPADRLYIGSSEGWLGRLDDAASTFNTPQDITGNNFPDKGYISCIAADPANTDRIMAVFSNYSIPSLFYSENGGATWTDVSGNLEEFPDGSGAGPSCRWADVVHTGSNTIWFVGTSTGLYSTAQLNGAQTEWFREGAGTIGSAVVSMIRTRQIDGYVAVATHGNGIFTTNAVPVSVPPLAHTPETFYLEPCVPNPVSTLATVRYSVPSAEPLTIKLYDALGREVRTLVEESTAPGIYQAQIETTGFVPGMYFIQLKAGSFAQTRMMVVR